MQKWLAAGAVMAGLLLVATPVRAQYGASKVEVRTQCLSDKDMETIRFLKSLKRLTTKDDPVMPPRTVEAVRDRSDFAVPTDHRERRRAARRAALDAAPV